MTRDAIQRLHLDTLTVDAPVGDRGALMDAVRRALAAQLSSHVAFAGVPANVLEATVTQTTDRVVSAVLPHFPASVRSPAHGASAQSSGINSC